MKLLRNCIILVMTSMTLISITAVAQNSNYSKMSLWVRQIARQQTEMNKNDNGIHTGEFCQKNNKKTHNLATPNNHAGKKPHLCALVKTSDGSDDAINHNGCKTIDKIGNIFIVSIPIDQLGRLAADTRIERIEAKPTNSIHLDSTSIITRTNHISDGLNLPQAFTGKGVVVGFQDVGFDLTHPTFYSSDLSQYRIKSFWDQLSVDTIGSTMYVGQTYESKAALLEYAHSRDNLIISHGTHTSSTAAGSGYNSRYKGIAPESDICLVNNAVSSDLPLIDSAEVYKYTYATDLLGFKYLFDYADKQGNPCVISFSEGSHQDLRGDDILYYEALEALLKPGHIIVASAGNEGTQTSMVPKPEGIQSAGTYIMSSSNKVVITAESTNDIAFRLLIYNNREHPDTLTIHTHNVFADQDSMFVDSVKTQGGTYSAEIHGFPSCYEPEKKAFDIIITAPETAGVKTPMWFEMNGSESNSRMLIASGYFYNTKMNVRTGNAVNGFNIHSPSSAPSVICVGATSHRHHYVNYKDEYMEPTTFITGQRAPYSSIGPTIDGRIKPDVVAPGTNLIAAYSSYYLEANPDASDIESDVEHFEFNNRTYAWNANTGTSMSTPVVAGIIALWLEADPTLTRERIMEIISKTSSHPDMTLTYPNNEYGYGAIDAYRGLLCVLGLDDSLNTEELSHAQPQLVRFNINNKLLTIAFSDEDDCSGELRIYSTCGQEVMKTYIKNNLQQIDLSRLNSGIYAIQLNTGNKLTTGSSLIRI